MSDGLPSSFVLELTRRCNHDCRYCYTPWGADALGYAPDDGRSMSPAVAQEIVSRLQESAPVNSIALSGGEPLLCADLASIVEMLRERDIQCTLITNGSLLIPERVAALAAVDIWEVPLLTVRPEVHRQLTGRPDWEDVVRGLLNLKRAGAVVVAVFVATRLNWMDLRQALDLALVLGARALMYNRLNLGARTFPHAAELLPTPAMLADNLAILEEYAVRYRMPITLGVPIEPCVLDMSRYPHLGSGACPRGGEGSYFTVDPAGNVRFCNHSPVVLGNILVTPFEDLYRHPHVRAFRSVWPPECAACLPAMRADCNGGCPAAAEQCYGALERVDPFVRLSTVLQASGDR